MVTIGGGILIDNQKRLLLIKRKFNKKNHPNCWGLPAGKKEINENELECAIREVKEEVGLDFKMTRLIFNFERDGDKFYYYLGKYSGNIKIQEEECDGYGWFNFEEINGLKLNGDMQNFVKNLKNDGIIY